MGLVKLGALVAAGATAMHMLDKKRHESEGNPPNHQQSNHQDNNYGASGSRQTSPYYDYPADAYQRSGPQPPVRYLQQQPSRGLEDAYARNSSGYIHQSYCNGSCNERCNGGMSNLPPYERHETLDRDVKSI